MKWIIAIAALYLIYKHNPEGAQQAASDTLTAAKQVASDITDAPTTPINNSPALGQPNVVPNYQTGVVTSPIYAQTSRIGEAEFTRTAQVY